MPWVGACEITRDACERNLGFAFSLLKRHWSQAEAS